MVFQILARLIHVIQPFMVPICLVVAWGSVLLTVWQIYATARDGVKRAKQMHQIPCPNCQFFTGDYNLKCTVHPMSALSEDAIDCVDYFPVSHSHVPE
jgi:hypothetical protein